MAQKLAEDDGKSREKRFIELPVTAHIYSFLSGSEVFHKIALLSWFHRDFLLEWKQLVTEGLSFKPVLANNDLQKWSYAF
jgi:hypothetical protein